MEDAKIIEQRGSHCLVACNGGYAVVEERNGEIYAIRAGSRDGYPKTASGLKAAVGRAGWCRETEARQLFDEITQRGADLAQRLW
jgi:hypothetical protein